MIICPKCGQQNRDGFRYCQACGTPLAPAEPPKPSVAEGVSDMTDCGNCATKNPPGMKFCKNCGSPLAQSSASGGGVPAATPAPQKANCASCGGETPSGFKFCQHCGAPLPTGVGPAYGAGRAGKIPPTGGSAPAMGPKDPAGNQVVVSEPSTGAPDDAAVAAGASVGGLMDPTLASGRKESARTILDVSLQAPASQNSPAPAAAESSGGSVAPSPPSGPAPSDSTPSAHTPPAGMPPGKMPQAMPSGADPDAATVLPESASEALEFSKNLPQPKAQKQTTNARRASSPPMTTDASPGGGGLERAVGPSIVADDGALARDVTPVEEPLLAKLISVQRDGSDGAVHDVRARSFDVGRVAGQLTFEDDRYLSERHFRLVLGDEGWSLQDLASFNGVYKRFTDPLDVDNTAFLLMGKQVVRFERLGVDERGFGASVEHGVVLFGSPEKESWGRLSQMTVAGVAGNVYYLHRPQVTVGREDGDLTFPDDEFMSRKHMAISHIDGKVVAQDLGSSNGTFIRIRGKTELATGDVIRVGDQLLRFEIA